MFDHSSGSAVKSGSLSLGEDLAMLGSSYHADLPANDVAILPPIGRASELSRHYKVRQLTPGQVEWRKIY